MSAEVGRLLEERGAILKGHFLLSSGRHSDVFVQKFRLFEQPAPTARCAEAIAESFSGAFDVVASPAVGAIVLGFATALAAGTRSVFAERVEGRMQFRRGFGLEPAERVLVVEDVVTTGGSARELIDLVAASGAAPAGVGALVDRTAAGSGGFAVPFKALVRLEASAWDAGACPLCAAGVPLQDPGSRRLGA
ncbi:MAG: orotate phosphoribosyltransferase [Actinobacteria bacterium]|nr:orotate phosphoribosyltransferase [Actinomycetota bacterium]